MDHLTRAPLLRASIVLAVAALGLFYVYVLSLARAPQIDDAYRLFFIEKALGIWPDSENLSYRVGETITLGAKQDPRIGRGFERANQGGMWTIGQTASFVLSPVEPEPGPYRVRIDVSKVFLSRRRNAQRVTLTAAGEEIGSWRLDQADGAVLSALLPAGALTDSEYLHLQLSLPDAHSPTSAGEGRDGRSLALFITSLTIAKMDDAPGP